MTAVADTSVLIDHLRGDDRARQLVKRATRSGARVVASVLTKVEILAGVRPHEAEATRRLLDRVEWIDVDDELAERAGALAARFVRSHPGIEVVDYVIAASAQRLDAELWTRNVRHFPMFPGLTAPYGP
ncbi:type II toxin-antitoxin system VapC family toxin [soil metagenome]|nr:type II toxin-antitoxin system VapC family toxin [Thermoleophilaceae bacterium]MDQ3240997.1 type II toxin-antitoxin system VapC family toxin [Actinomycetota bacterium]MDQ3318777.1 type II toxin-antitoxin system VapC family toxin [Actinomycetota bacterium]MDQ3356541.1 type II toxin-antitoxin system VapC family toxin [Actinomycetota bacterium]